MSSTDNLHSYPPDSHHCSDVVYWKQEQHAQRTTALRLCWQSFKSWWCITPWLNSHTKNNDIARSAELWHDAYKQQTNVFVFAVFACRWRGPDKNWSRTREVFERQSQRTWRRRTDASRDKFLCTGLQCNFRLMMLRLLSTLLNATRTCFVGGQLTANNMGSVICLQLHLVDWRQSTCTVCGCKDDAAIAHRPRRRNYHYHRDVRLCCQCRGASFGTCCKLCSTLETGASKWTNTAAARRQLWKVNQAPPLHAYLHCSPECRRCRLQRRITYVQLYFIVIHCNTQRCGSPGATFTGL